jgi:hypothetical protein
MSDFVELLGTRGTCETCSCAETLVKGERVEPQLPRHDCRYVRARNALIPEAVEIADGKAKGRGDGAKWTKAFATAMDELSAPLLNGQRSGG